jgi:hypothetical protein
MRGKKRARSPDPPGGHPPDLGPGVRGRGLVEPLGAAGPAQLGRTGPAAAAGRTGGRERRSGSESAGVLRPAGPRGSARRRPGRWDLAALCGRPAGERAHDRVSGVVLPPVGGGREGSAAAGLGQCVLAWQSGGAPVDPRPQSAGEGHRPGGADPGPATCRARARGSIRSRPSGPMASGAWSNRPGCSPLPNSARGSVPRSTVPRRTCWVCRTRSILISSFPKRLPDRALGSRSGEV